MRTAPDGLAEAALARPGESRWRVLLRSGAVLAAWPGRCVRPARLRADRQRHHFPEWGPSNPQPGIRVAEGTCGLIGLARLPRAVRARTLLPPTHRTPPAMNAWVVTRYGSPDVLELREVETPEPEEDQLRVRIHATTVSSGDWRIRSMNVPRGFGLMTRLVFGLTAPRSPILGTEFAGRIDRVGRDVTGFAVGDAVFGNTDATMGAHAEYIVMDADAAIAPAPENLSFGEAAAMSFGGSTGLQFLPRGGIESGHRVLINGASGAVGSAAVQLARAFGAHVTGVCSAANGDLVRSLGADDVVDYRATDISDSGETWDIIMDTAGTMPYRRAKRILADGGSLLVVLGDAPAMLSAPFISMASKHRVAAGPASGTAEDLKLLADLAKNDEYRPVVDSWYPFEEMVEAHRRVDTGHKRGNVVVRVVDSDPPPPTRSS